MLQLYTVNHVSRRCVSAGTAVRRHLTANAAAAAAAAAARGSGAAGTRGHSFVTVAATAVAASCAVAALLLAGDGVQIRSQAAAAQPFSTGKNRPLAPKHRVSIVAGVLRNAAWAGDRRCSSLPGFRPNHYLKPSSLSRNKFGASIDKLRLCLCFAAMLSHLKGAGYVRETAQPD